MKNIKIFSSYIILSLAALFLLPLAVKATNEVSVYFDKDNNEYLIYTEAYTGTCEYFPSDDNSITPPIYYTCGTDGINNVIKVSASNIEDFRYIWLKKDNIEILTAFDLSTYYTNALSSNIADFIGNTTKRIAVTHGNGIITVSDTNYTNYKYVLVKVDDNDYNMLEARTSQLKTLDSGGSPLASLNSMKAFYESYNSLLPNASDTRWTELSTDNIIQEPLETQTGDIYVVWLMADKGASKVYDMQIMYCLREDEPITVTYTEEFIKKLPYTGMNYLIDGFLCVNAVALPLVYLKKRKVETETSEE